MIAKLKAWLREWLGIAHYELELALHQTAINENRAYDNSLHSRALELEISERQKGERDSLSRDQTALDQIRLNHDTLLSNVKSIVEAHVEEHITRLQSSQHRFVSCPVCGRSYNLAASGAAYNTRAITIACENCKSHFEVRPSLFWNKIEVEKR